MCDEGSTAPIPASCPPGSFLDAALATTVDDAMEACLPCSRGYWCSGGAAVQRECPRGSFCAAGASEPTSCAAGRFGSVTGLWDAACSGTCQRGYFCGAGSMSAKAAPCAEGSYGAAEGLVAQVNCSFCAEGHACPEAATEPVPCGPGTVQPLAEQGTCAR